MATPIAQVDVRIGDTMLERVYVRAGEHLAVAGIGAFPLVMDATGFVVRTRDGEARLAPGEVMTSRLGLATVEVRLAELVRVPVPRPSVDPRPAIYIAVSLAAQVSIWAAAMRVPLPAPPPRRTLARIVHHSREPPPPPPKPAPKPEPPPTPAPTSKPARRTAKPESSMAHVTAAIADVARATKIDWAAAFSGVGSAYSPDEAPGFGQRPAFQGLGTIPSAPYAAIMSGDPLVYCMSTCRATGPIGLRQLSTDLEDAWSALTKCDYMHGPAILSFTIETDGHASVTQIEGDGGDCAAKIIAANPVPAMASPTEVLLSLGYK